MNYYRYRGNLSIIYLFVNLLRFCMFCTAYEIISFELTIKRTLAGEMCKQMGVKPGLLDLCQDKVSIFSNAMIGFERGIHECRTVFKKDRWNCTTLASSNRHHELFGTVMARGSKEAAVMFAMASAGMVEWITVQIYKGKRNEKYSGVSNGCSLIRQPRTPGEYVNPKDCDVDVTRGNFFAKKVIDRWLLTQKTSRRERLMNSHNAAVGRMAIEEHLEKTCRCVGLSGACNAKCCYRTLQPLKVSIEWLHKQYKKARKVKTGPRTKRDGTARLVTADNSGTPGKTDLIYLFNSPNYCYHDNDTGSLGTRGRQCNATSTGSYSCKTMCCGRGYETHELIEDKYCHCKFNWCCEVKCERCREKVIVHRCK